MQVSVELVKTVQLVYKDTSFKIMQMIVKIILRKDKQVNKDTSFKSV
jgi:hypothetical protein